MSVIKKPGEFPTKRLLEEFVKNIFLRNVNTCITSGLDFDFLLELMTHHLEYESKSEGGIAGFRLQAGNHLFIIHPNSVEIDVSWRHCCNQAKGRKKRTREENNREWLSQAMRFAVKPQIDEYRDEQIKNKSFLCNQCGSGKNLQVDHVVPKCFKTLTERFQRLTNHILVTPETEEDLPNHEILLCICFGETKVAKAFEKAWIDYHKCNAVLRMLCCKCNNQTANKPLRQI